MADVFLDTNVLVYLLSSNARKAQVARRLIDDGGTISVQVLGEFTNVARRKAGLDLTAIRDVTDLLRDLLTVVPITEEVFETALRVAEVTGYSTYDSMIVAAALRSDADVLLSEDMQAGRKIEGLTIVNPFTAE